MADEEAVDVPCPHCGEPNEKCREICWACSQRLDQPAAKLPPYEIALDLDGRTYHSSAPDLSEDVRALLDAIRAEGNSEKLLADWRAWRARRNEFSDFPDFSAWRRLNAPLEAARWTSGVPGGHGPFSVWRMAVVWLIVGVPGGLFLWLGVNEHSQLRRDLHRTRALAQARTKAAMGTVSEEHVAFAAKTGTPGKEGTVSFTTESGREARIRLPLPDDRANVGLKLSVRYDPRNPERNFSIVGMEYSDGYFTAVLPALFPILMGLFLLAAGFLAGIAAGGG